MLTRLALLAMAAILAFFALPTLATEAEAADGPVNIFVVAHQDDEILMMGPDIRRHADGPGTTIVVLATDGGASNARFKLEAKLGYLPTREDFVTHRDFEFEWTCRALGADICEIYPNRSRDGELTPEAAGELFKHYAAKYPGARFKTHSWYDWHADHRTLGLALDGLRSAGIITDARFYIRTDYGRMGVNTPFPLPPHGKPTAAVGDDEQNAYRLWAPNKAHNRYWAIGYLSTPNLFNQQRKDPRCYVHASTAEFEVQGWWPGHAQAEAWLAKQYAK